MKIKLSKLGTTIALGLCLSLPLYACGATTNSGSQAQDSTAESSAPEKPEIKAEDISYTVDQALINKSATNAVTITNNSPYKILELQFDFAPKEDLSDEQISSVNNIYDNAQEDFVEYGFTANDYAAFDAGSTSDPLPILLGITYVENASFMDLVEPKTITYSFLGNDNLIYDAQIDCTSGKTLLGPDTFDTTQWFHSEPASSLPKPEGGILTSLNEYDDSACNFDAADVTQEEFDAYVAKLKESGYDTVDIESGETFKAANADGTYEVRASYNESFKEISFNLSKN